MDAKHLSALGRKYVDHVGGTLSTLSTRMAGGGAVLPNIEAGRQTVTVKKFNRLLNWFSSNWPSDLDWPEGIPRPDETMPQQKTPLNKTKSHEGAGA